MRIICRPYYLPRLIIVQSPFQFFYIPPNVDNKVALQKLNNIAHVCKSQHPKGIFIVLGDSKKSSETDTDRGQWMQLVTVHARIHRLGYPY